MKLLVTGGAGFIGSNFIRYILDNNKDTSVLNLDDLKYGSNPANLSDLEKDSRYSFFKGDISNFSLVSKLIQRCRRNSKLCSRDSRRQKHLCTGSISAEQCSRHVHYS